MLSNWPALRKVREKFFRCHRECHRQLHDIFQANVSFASLYSPHIVSVEAGSLGEILLGIPLLFAESPQCIAKPRFSGPRSHPSMLETVTTMSLHTMSVILYQRGGMINGGMAQ